MLLVFASLITENAVQKNWNQKIGVKYREPMKVNLWLEICISSLINNKGEI